MSYSTSCQPFHSRPDCSPPYSKDPLDQIHESDADQPRDVNDVHPEATSSGQGGVDHEGDKSSPQRIRPKVLYLEKEVPLRDSIMWKLQR